MESGWTKIAKNLLGARLVVLPLVQRQCRIGLQVITADVTLFPLILDQVQVVGISVTRANMNGREAGRAERAFRAGLFLFALLLIVLRLNVNRENIRIGKVEFTYFAFEPQLTDDIGMFPLSVAPTETGDYKRLLTEHASRHLSARRQLPVSKTGRGHLVFGQVVTVEALNGWTKHVTVVAARPDF